MVGSSVQSEEYREKIFVRRQKGIVFIESVIGFGESLWGGGVLDHPWRLGWTDQLTPRNV